MRIRGQRVFHGVVASVLLFTTPALAESAIPPKQRVASLGRRAASTRQSRPRRLTTTDLNNRELARIAPEAAATLAEPDAPSPQKIETGTASWYGPGFQGRLASDGSRFNEHDLTAAHRWLPLGTRVRVTLAGTDHSVDVTITDRPGTRRRIIDLSRRAARDLGILRQGTAEVVISRL